MKIQFNNTLRRSIRRAAAVRTRPSAPVPVARWRGRVSSIDRLILVPYRAASLRGWSTTSAAISSYTAGI